MRSFTALVNPIAGGGHATEVCDTVTGLLREAGATVVVAATQSSEHAIKLATEAAADGQVVIAVGGDGLMRDAAAGVVASGGVLGVVPAGRGNDLARALGMPATPHEMASLLLDGPTRTIDVLEANGVIVPGNVYIGIDSVATQIINNTRWLPGLLTYRLAPVRAILSWHSPTYTVVADGERRSVPAFSVVVANSGAYGHGLRIVPPAVLDDGLLDVMIVGDGPRREIVKFMKEAKTGAHVARPEVQLSTAREVTVDADRPLPVCADGDEIGELPVTVRLLPAALGVIAPVASPYEP